MRIVDALGAGKPSFSFEFFPPKTQAGEQSLFRTVAELADLLPTYISVTYGAGGSTRDKTVRWASRIKREFGIEAMAHLTCVGQSRDEIAVVLDELQSSGIENVIALRGDPPLGQAEFVPHADGFHFAADLAEFIRRERYPFCIAGACYPEGHIECADKRLDLDRLAAKVRAGVDFLITQLFFDNAFYFDFVQRARAAGISVPIVPGIMPITNVEQLDRFTRMCGATVPMRLALELERRKNDPEAVVELGVAHATLQCTDLLERGAPGVHFYTLNRSPAARMILTALRVHHV